MNSQHFYLLEQEMFTSSRTKIRVHWFDYAFLMAALVFICGGCLMALDLASSHSAGQVSVFSQLLTTAQEWQPVVWERLCTGVMLLAASVVNSALMAVFIQVLRQLDRKVSRSRQRQWQRMRMVRTPSRGVVANTAATHSAALSGFLLNPLIR